MDISKSTTPAARGVPAAQPHDHTGDKLHAVLAQETLAALIASPANVAEKHSNRLEPEDFQDWRARKTFAAFTHCVSPSHSEPGSLITQINGWLLNEGAYKDSDDGLRAAVIALAETRGHPEQLPELVNDLLSQRFRRALAEHAGALSTHAVDMPLHDLAERLNVAIKDLRRLYSRIPSQGNLRAVKDGGAA